MVANSDEMRRAAPRRQRTAREQGGTALDAPMTDDGQAGERRQEILEVAAQLFAEHGYRSTSIRDIADRVGMLPGSLYYHIRSKEALFVEIHDKALDAAAIRVRNAIEPLADPWDRLLAACEEMVEIQLNPSSLTLPIMNIFRSVPPEVKVALLRKRDEFETIFRTIVEDLPLPAELDRSIYRILLLRLLNTADEWYHEGRLTRREIAGQIVAIFRHDATFGETRA
ncbi:TetR/AcrR family transcriptional regulator [Acetobacter sp. DsW_063]|uniref:TetR/AcrR family transcriptional regulator n=1 Tax=Acetobacter sp. DsW_063 TaxID=1514894 RepID=UPI001E5038C1|nr:TetR/AcrR family transcriptional regulator [Acetobacter sp. DsW_063]